MTRTGHGGKLGTDPRAFKPARFQVLSDGTYAYVRTTIANLTPTFGAVDGAQLLDRHVRGVEPAGGGAGFRGAGVGGRVGEHRRDPVRAR